LPLKSPAADADRGAKSQRLTGTGTTGFNRYWYVVAAAAIAYLFFVSHVISFLTENVNETAFEDAVRPLLVGLILCAFIGVSLFFGSRSKALALISAVLIYIFFYFGILQYSSFINVIFDLIQKNLGFTIHNGSITLSFLCLVAAVLVLFLRWLGDDRALLIVGGFAVANSAAAILNYNLARTDMIDAAVALPPPAALELAAAPDQLPDIFYIVPDRYGSASGLKHLFGFDNTEFLEALKQRGFYVAEEAFANYPQTSWSLASSLNMAYLDALTEKYGRDYASQLPLFHLVENNTVQSILKRLGYRYVHTASQWQGTMWNDHADVNFSAVSNLDRVLRLTEVEIKLLNMTPLGAVARRFEHGAYPGCERIRKQLDFIRNAGGQRKPTFVFAHLMIPHDPILLDAEGRCIEPTGYDPSDRQAFGRAFASYLKFGNTELLEIIDEQQRANPNGVIFIIQADEGPYPHSLRDERDTYASLPPADLAAKLGILNAVYIPGSRYRRFYPSLSPVNNWRLVLSHLLGQDLPLVEDRSFVFTAKDRVFDFRDVTDQLAGRPPANRVSD
jgi:hypothetical protein